MNMNPGAIMQIMGAVNTFKGNHPKFVNYVNDVFKTGLPEGTVVELTVKKPGEDAKTTNIVVKQSDLDLVDSLKNMQ